MIHDRERQHYNPQFPQSLRQEEFNYLVLVLHYCHLESMQ